MRPAAEVNETLGIYVMPGRAKDAARAPVEAAEAERMGLGTAWISDRRDVKEGGVLSAAMAQATSRIRVGTAVTHVGTRHPLVLAAIGASMQSLSGGRFRMGFGRSTGGTFTALGLTPPSIDAMRDNASLLRRLWRGERVDYDGPLGTFSDLALGTSYDGEAPELLLAAGGPKMLHLAGEAYDGVFLEPSISASTVARFAQAARDAAERAGRDPAALRVVAVVVVAADMTAEQEAAVLGGRLVTYLQTPGFGERVCDVNGWDREVLDTIRNHPLFAGHGHEHAYADANFTLAQLAEVADELPSHFIRDTNATGDAAQAAARLREYLDAGADELILHGSSPAELTPVVAELAPTGAIR